MKGQVSMFIIIALIILITSIILLNPPDTQIKGIGSEDIEFKKYASQCLDIAAKQAVIQTTSQGGMAYDLAFHPSIEAFGLAIPYHSYKEQLMIPDVSDIEKVHLSGYCESALIDCLSSYPQSDIQIDKPHVTSIIGEELILFNADVSYTITNGKLETKKQETFNSKLPSRIRLLLELSKKFISLEDNGMIAMSEINLLSMENNVSVDIIPYNSKSWIYLIKDPQNPIGNNSIRYYFASGG